MGDVKGAHNSRMSRWMIIGLSGTSFSATRNGISDDRDPLHYAVFIDPPLAHIGISEEEALKGDILLRFPDCRQLPLSVHAHCRQTDGMLKAIINNHSGKIMGCTLFCTDAQELINIVAMAMKTGQHSTFLRDFIFTHPSMSEGLNQLFDVKNKKEYNQLNTEPL